MRLKSSSAPRASTGLLKVMMTLLDMSFFLRLLAALSARTFHEPRWTCSVAVSGGRLNLGWCCGKPLLVFPNRDDREYLDEKTVEKDEVAKRPAHQRDLNPRRA